MTTPTKKKQSPSKKQSPPGSKGKVPKTNVPLNGITEMPAEPKVSLKRSSPRILQFTTQSLQRIGTIFQKARLKKKMSLDDVEQITGVSSSSVNAIERCNRTSIGLDVFMMLFRVLQPQKESGEFYTLEDLIYIALEENPFLEDLEDVESWAAQRYQNRLQSTMHHFQKTSKLTVRQIADRAKLPQSRIQAMFDGVMPESLTAEEAIKLSSVIPNPYEPGAIWTAEDFIEFICKRRLISFDRDAHLRDRLENLL